MFEEDRAEYLELCQRPKIEHFGKIVYGLVKKGVFLRNLWKYIKEIYFWIFFL